MEAFTDNFTSCFWYLFMPICLLMMCYLWYDMFGSDKRKPKYRLDKDGYLQFYYRRYSCWFDFPLWNDNNDERKVEVHDRVRDLDYTISYIGPGRAKIKYLFDNNAPITRDFITDHFRKTYPEFKNSEQLFQLHNLYVDKENAILNKIVKDHIFKAHESNS